MAALTAATVLILLFSVQFNPVVSRVEVTVRSDPPDPDPVFLAPTLSLRLMCTTTNLEGKLIWTWFDQSINKEILIRNMSGVDVIDDRDGSKVGIKLLNGKHGGRYTCTDGVDSATYYANVLDSNSIIPRHVMGNGSETTTLKCDQRFKELFPIIWIRKEKDGTETFLSNDPTGTYVVGDKENGYSLTIKNTNKKRFPDLTGDYICRLKTSDLKYPIREVLQQTVKYRTLPDVRIEGATAGKSKSATKDESFSITCVYSGGSENGRLVWTFSANGTDETVILDQGLNDRFGNLSACADDSGKNCSAGGFIFSRNDKIEEESAKSEAGKSVAQFEQTSVLEFDSIQEKDRGTYSCAVGNENGVNKASVEVKVKDKLAALWPFLGIVAEVVILCAIIFISEKRRNKTVDEEDDNEPIHFVPIKNDLSEKKDLGTNGVIKNGNGVIHARNSKHTKIFKGHNQSFTTKTKGQRELCD